MEEMNIEEQPVISSRDDYEADTQKDKQSILKSIESGFCEKYGNNASDEQFSEYLVGYIKDGGPLDFESLECMISPPFGKDDTIQRTLRERLVSGDDVKAILGEVGEKYEEDGLPDIAALAKMVEMVKDDEKAQQCRDFFTSFVVGKAVESTQDGTDNRFYQLTKIAGFDGGLLGDNPESSVIKTAKNIAELCGDEATIVQEGDDIEKIGELFANAHFSGAELFDENGPTKITQDYLVWRGASDEAGLFYDDTHRKVKEIEKQAGIKIQNIDDQSIHYIICATMVRGFSEDTIRLLTGGMSSIRSEKLIPCLAFSSEEDFLKMFPTIANDNYRDLDEEYQPAIEKFKEIKDGQKDIFFVMTEMMRVANGLSNDQTKLDTWEKRQLTEMYKGREKSEEQKIKLEQNRRKQEWYERDINSRLTTLDEIERQSLDPDSGIKREEDEEYDGKKVPIYRISPDYPFYSVVNKINYGVDSITSRDDSERQRLQVLLEADPSVWMKNKEDAMAEGGSPAIHASYIMNDKGHASNNNGSLKTPPIFYGFSHIHAKSLIETYEEDGNTGDNDTEEMTEGKYNIKDFGDIRFENKHYNELVLRRYQETGQPLYVPDYIVCFRPFFPTSKMLMHAAYFGIPVIIVEGDR